MVKLLKLGFELAQSSVAKYMVKRRGPPSQGWRTFLRNHAPDVAAMDLFVVPTIGFKLLYGFVIIRLDRRDIVWINVTTNPTAEWVARQITEAFLWDGAPRYQGWRIFLRNHAPEIAAMDLFVVPTVGFDLLFALVIVRLDRRDLVWINVTRNPTAEWVARQITEAFPWDEAPGYMIRDRDCIYGSIVTRRLRAMGIRDKPTAPASPWQNGYAERLIGSIQSAVRHSRSAKAMPVR